MLTVSLPAFSWEAPERNFDRVEYEKLRKEIDKKYNDLHDQLSDCYYNHWREGETCEFQGYDVLLTPEQNKEQFDELHGLLWIMYQDYFHRENLKQPEADKIPEERYNIDYDEEGNPLPDKRDKKAKDKIKDYKNKGYEIDEDAVITTTNIIHR
jgi:hypothetical protein